MSATVPEPAPPPDTAAAQLDQLEQQAETDITAALAGVATGAALLALLPVLLAIILGAATTALGVGIAIAQAAAGTRRPRPLTGQPIPSAVDDDLAAILGDAARRIDGAAGEGDAVQGEIDAARARLVRLATTKIHQAASAGTAMYARALGLGLEWVTLREGACPTCLRMHGARVGPGEPVRQPTGFDNPEVRRAIARFAATVIREMFRKPRKSDYVLWPPQPEEENDQ